MRIEENENELALQEGFPWQRSKYHTDYNSVLAHFKVVSCLEHSKGDSLLDIACGDGTLTEQFANHFDRVVGVDAGSEHLKAARNRVAKGRFFHSLIEEFELEEKFGTVMMLDLLEHVRNPGDVLRKAASFLEDGGNLIVHVPNCDAINRRIAVLMGTLKSCDELSPFDLEIAGHRRSYNLETLAREVEDAGLVVKSTGGIFYKMLSTPQIDWFLKNGQWESGHGWGRSGEETARDWKTEFCRACYEYGKEHPEDCNVIYACITNP